ncbi:MAG: hypothetical protein Q7S01_03190 [bacterium]|nr:hypothetical protein [bacterium]
MKARKILSITVLISLAGLFSPPFLPYASAYTASALLGAAPEVGAGSTVVLEEAVSAVALNAAASVAATAQCTGYTYVEGFRSCWDITLGLPTWGMCVAPSVCLGLGTVSIFAAGMLVAGSIFGGNDSGSGGAYPPGMPLPSGSISGCSGTPRISATPSSDPCLVYVPDTARTAGTQTYGNISTNSNYGSTLSSNAYGSNTLSSSANNTLLNSGANSSNTYSASAVSDILQGSGAVQTDAISSRGSASQLAASSYVGTDSYTGSMSDTGFLNFISGNTSNASQSLSGANTSAKAANASGQSVTQSGLQLGTWGDIQATALGVTISGGRHETDGRTGIGRFYGYDAVLGVDPQALARQMCKTRPWVSSIDGVPPSFFDSICSSRGYDEISVATQIKSTVRAEAMVANASSASNATPTGSSEETAATSTKNSSLGLVLVGPPPSIVISAIPARIRIGARSTIYWSAKNVTSCVASSPDGSFQEDALSGAAGTVALYEDTMFTISCSTPAGSIVTKSVVVETSD